MHHLLLKLLVWVCVCWTWGASKKKLIKSLQISGYNDVEQPNRINFACTGFKTVFKYRRTTINRPDLGWIRVYGNQAGLLKSNNYNQLIYWASQASRISCLFTRTAIREVEQPAPVFCIQPCRWTPANPSPQIPNLDCQIVAEWAPLNGSLDAIAIHPFRAPLVSCMTIT